MNSEFLRFEYQMVGEDPEVLPSIEDSFLSTKLAVLDHVVREESMLQVILQIELIDVLWVVLIVENLLLLLFSEL